MIQDVEEIALLEEEDHTFKPESSFNLRRQTISGKDSKRTASTVSSERTMIELVAMVTPMLIGTFLSSLDSTIVVASYAAIGGELKELQSASWISTGYMLTLTSLQPLYGKLSDIFGRKSCLLAAYAIFALGCLACGVARTMPQLILARMLAGVGGGGMTTIVSIVLSDLVPLRSRGLWHGVLNVVWASGSSVGAPLGGFLAESVGWRWSFTLQAPIAMIAFCTVAAILDIPNPSPGNFRNKLRRVDFAGSLCLTFSLAALLTSLDRGGNVGWTDKLTIMMFATFVATLGIFIVVEAKIAQEPVVPKTMVTDPALLYVYVSNLFSRGCSMCFIFYLPLYLQAVTQRTAAHAGASLIPSMAANVVGSFLGGTVIKTTGKFQKVTVVMHAVMVVGSILMLFMTGVMGRSYIAVEVGLIMMSLGNSCGLTTTLVALVAHAQDDQAIASAVMYLFRSLGSVLCLSIGSTIFQSTLRNTLARDIRSGNAEEIIQQARASLGFIEDLEPSMQAVVRGAYDQALHIEFAFCIFLAAATLVSSLWIRDRSLAIRSPT